MAESGVDWTLDGMSNPMIVQEQLLDRFENDTGGVVVDTNNPASELMESFASITSKTIKKIEDEVRPAIYPACTNNATDLYKHLSDYDYIDVFASPATSTLQMIVDRVYVYNNSIPVPGTTYRKMVIPASTKFTIGEHKFGIYYPIEIRSNESTGRFSVVYDTTTPNPLHTLSNNALEYDIRRYSGHDLVFIKIPVYQFEMTVIEESLISGSGYRRDIPHNDKFYAIRCTAEVLQNRGHDDTEEDIFETKELSLCVSGQVYDPDTVTAVFTPDLENNSCLVEIPYVYFSNGMIRGTLHIELYTSKGELLYSIPTDTQEVCTIDMFSQITDETVATYADPFKRMPALQVIPLSTSIIGGSNGMTFDTLKQRVVTGTIKSKTLQTPDDIDAYFANQGYVTTLLRDGITDRIFLCHSTVRNTAGEVIGADAIGTLFDFRDESISNYDTIVRGKGDVNTFTVLPSTMYRLDTTTGVCKPLTMTNRLALDHLIPTEKIEMFNNNIFTISPYHLKVDISSKYPATVTYDMTDVAITSREFIGDRIEPNCQLILNASTLTTVKGTSGIKDDYRLTFRVSRSGLDDVNAVVSDGDAVGRKNFRCIVGLKNDDGVFSFAEATWDSWTGEYDIYHIDIASDYIFHTANNEHTVMMQFGNNVSTDVYLTAEVRVMLLINGDINSVAKLVGKDNHYLDTDFTIAGPDILDSTKNYYALSEHKLMCRFGSVINELDQHINLAYSEKGYLKYHTTKFKTLEVPLYKTNSDGTLVIEQGKFVYTPTEDVIFNLTKVYYSRTAATQTGDPPYTYTQIDPESVRDPETHALPSPVSKGYYEQSHSMTVRELYPKGTLTCVTKDEESSMYLNAYTIENYYGREAAYVDDDKKVQYTTIDTHTLETLSNKEFYFEKAPIVPMFMINDAAMTTAGDPSYAIGKYEMYKAKEQPGLSHPGNLWYKTGSLIGNDVQNASRVYAQDALYYVFNNIIGKFDDEGGTITYQEDPKYMVTLPVNVTDPDGRMKAPKGTFMMVKNDMTVVDNYVPIIAELRADQKGSPERPEPIASRAVLYYCVDTEVVDGNITSSTWIQVAQGESVSAMAVQIYANAIASQYKKDYGFVYILKAFGKTTGATPVINYQTFVTFLNTRIVNGYEVPNFDKFDQDKLDFPASKDTTPVTGREYYMCLYVNDPTEGRYLKEAEKLTISSADDLTAKYAEATEYNQQEARLRDHEEKVVSYLVVTENYGWMTYVNKWPWDVKTWFVLETNGSCKITDETATRTALYNFTVDDKFTSAFDNGRLVPYCEYTSGQYRLVNGELQEDPDNPRIVQYLIEMLQLDAKLSQTTANKATNAFPRNVTDILRTHFTLLGECRQNMFTNTRLLFYPSRSLGLAKFELGDSAVGEIRMDVSVGFKLYVAASTAEDTTLLNNIHTKIVNIIDEKIESTGSLNCSEVASEIMSQLSDSIFRIDLLGINGDVNLQTIKCVDKEAKVHLGHQLTLLSDELTIDIVRSLNLEVTVVED